MEESNLQDVNIRGEIYGGHFLYTLFPSACEHEKCYVLPLNLTQKEGFANFQGSAVLVFDPVSVTPTHQGLDIELPQLPNMHGFFNGPAARWKETLFQESTL